MPACALKSHSAPSWLPPSPHLSPPTHTLSHHHTRPLPRTAAVSGVDAFIEFFLNPVLGNASDMFGRKTILMYSLMGGVIQLGIVAVYPSKFSMAFAGVVRGFSQVTGSMVYSMVGAVQC